MMQFAERLRDLTPDLAWPVADATGLEGTWDLTLTFSPFGPLPSDAPAAGFGAAAGGAPLAAVPSASDPSGIITIFQAIEKQLGLKLEKEKRPMPVFVIDRLERKPVED